MQPIQSFGLEHPLRAAARTDVRSRMGALAITFVAHLIAVMVLLAGLAPSSLRIQEITVALSFPHPAAKEEKILPPPTMVSVINAAEPPPPVVQIAPEAAAPPPPPRAVTFDFKLPPMQLPSPPNSAVGGNNARATWETALLARLAAAKHMPAGKSQGVVLLRFIMDREGAVLLVKVERSSGAAVLDQEALAALQRAVPLPKPPQEVPGDSLDLIVPVDFYS